MLENYTESARLFLVALFAGLIGIIALTLFIIFHHNPRVKPYVMPERKEAVTLMCSSEAYGEYLDEDGSDRRITLPDRPGVYCLKQSGTHRWSLYDAKENKQPH